MDITALKKTIAEGEAKLAEQKAQLATARAEQKKDKVAEMKEAIKDFELTPYDLFDIKKPRKTAGAKTVGVAKYKSKDGLHTWTGKGRTPTFMEEYVKGGGKKEDLLIVVK